MAIFSHDRYQSEHSSDPHRQRSWLLTYDMMIVVILLKSLQLFLGISCQPKLKLFLFFCGGGVEGLRNNPQRADEESRSRTLQKP